MRNPALKKYKNKYDSRDDGMNCDSRDVVNDDDVMDDGNDEQRNCESSDDGDCDGMDNGRDDGRDWHAL